MGFDAEPLVGTRYRDLETEQEFEVISLDDYEGIVNVLYDDADEEITISLDDWYEMSLHVDDNADWGKSEMTPMEDFE
ncbi:MAG: hypothetical protein PVF75_03290 [Granulosicoccaceae bacterium]|jgi:hypothetical protein